MKKVPSSQRHFTVAATFNFVCFASVVLIFHTTFSNVKYSEKI